MSPIYKNNSSFKSRSGSVEIHEKWKYSREFVTLTNKDIYNREMRVLR